MNAHVTNIARTSYSELRSLSAICRSMTSTVTATLESAFALSRVDYYNSLLFGSTHDVTSHFQRIQNYAARVILRLPKSSSIITHLKSLHWLPVKVRSTYKIVCLCYHCHSSTAPSYVDQDYHDCLLYIVLAYLMLFTALTNAVCLYNAYFWSLIFANAFSFHALPWLLTHSLLLIFLSTETTQEKISDFLCNKRP